MSFFRKKIEEKKQSKCCCKKSGDRAPEENPEQKVLCRNEGDDGICRIKVLGSGCKNCRALYENTQEAVRNLGIDAQIEYVTDFARIAQYGVMSVPALVINDAVVSCGKVLKADGVERLLEKLK